MEGGFKEAIHWPRCVAKQIEYISINVDACSASHKATTFTTTTKTSSPRVVVVVVIVVVALLNAHPDRIQKEILKLGTELVSGATRRQLTRNSRRTRYPSPATQCPVKLYGFENLENIQTP